MSDELSATQGVAVEHATDLGATEAPVPTAPDAPTLTTVAAPFVATETVQQPPAPLSALEHVEAWWKELKDSAPAAHQKAFWLYAEEQWQGLVDRLKGL